MTKSKKLQPRNELGRFTSKEDPIITTAQSSRDPSPSANPLNSPESDTTARPDLVFPSSSAHLPGSFPSEDSVSFSRLVVAAADQLASSSSSDSIPSSDFSPPSDSSSSVSPAPDSSNITLGALLDLDDVDPLDPQIDSLPASHFTIATSSAAVHPPDPKSQLSPEKRASLSKNRLSSVEEALSDLPPVSSSHLSLPSRHLLTPVIPTTKATKLTHIPRHKMSGATAPSGPAAMPAPRSNKAPFFGDQSGDTLEVFLREYENLASTHGLTAREKVEQIIRYVSPELCDLWQLLDGYSTRD